MPILVNRIKDAGRICEGFTSFYSQGERQDLLRRFEEPDDPLKLMVCTQILGRGHDFKDLQYVINYDMPDNIVQYVHRVGRTGRAGKQGFALTLMREGDLVHAKSIKSCLEETKHPVPDFILQACGKKRQVRARHAQEREKTLPAVPGAAAPEAEVGPAVPSSYGPPPFGSKRAEESQDHWQGRGKGRRAEFLHQCESRWAAGSVAAP